ncbi:MAG: nucleoside triphosphate pyrophosphohydrolase, partial [Rickettsiales bacterium]
MEQCEKVDKLPYGKTSEELSQVDKNISAINELLEIMARLRNPDGGCPWDVEQNFQSIASCTLEEAYEVVDAIMENDMSALREELGDLLLQVVFHSQMAKEKGLFDFNDVAHAISEKLVRRHPHVFGDETIETAEAQTAAWEAIKAEERKAKGQSDAPESALDGIAKALPSLTRAYKLQKRAAKV